MDETEPSSEMTKTHLEEQRKRLVLVWVMLLDADEIRFWPALCRPKDDNDGMRTVFLLSINSTIEVPHIFF